MSEERIHVAAPVLGAREIALVNDAVTSGWVSSIGPYLDKFEAGFAAFSGARHAIAVSNGTTAIHLALHALGLGPGDEVIVPDLTFAATAHAVLQTGATPVFADVEADTWCLDPAAVERAITKKTRAILAVDLYGHPADMKRLGAIASASNAVLVEDAAEAHGASIDGVRTGALGRIGTFSFYGNKIITTGEGGMVTTSDDALADRVRFLKDHGMSKTRRYFHTELAFNYRMTNLQAALGVAQLERVEELIAKKRAIMDRYRAILSGADLALNVERPGCKSVYWMACAVLGDSIKRSRDEVMARLSELGIDSRPFFVPMSALPHLSSYRTVGARGDGCPVSVHVGARGLNLPSGCGLTDAQVDRSARALLAAIG